MEQTIYWGADTSDKITISYSGTIGNSVITVTSDPNRSYQPRTKKLNLIDGNGETLAVLTINQDELLGSYSNSYEERYK